MQKKDIEKLLLKYKAGHCTEEEKAMLETWYLYYEDNEQADLSDHERASDLEDIRASLLFERPVVNRSAFVSRIAAAAAVIVFALVGAWYFDKNDPVPEKVISAVLPQQDVAPGSNKATLTLADGSVIQLDQVGEGTIAEQAGITITKTADGQLIYTVLESSPGLNNVSTNHNTIKTPRGGQYQVNLPDGTKVWLNAASSLRYPTHFSGTERNVELSGEGYFEVAHNENMPFYVISGDQTVEVLGTHFNISSYTDDPEIKTNLIEGSVIVKSTKGRSLLKPGEQALLSKKNQFISVSAGDSDAAIAWKNGYFHFDRDNIQDIMKELSRWYDIEVVYEGKIPEDEFVGKIRRSVTLSQSLKMLKLSSIHFRIEGRKITITG